MSKLPRIEVADALRGFAVLTILLLHSIEHFNFYSFPEESCSFLQFTNKAIWDSLFFGFAGKAYAIFALLFGLSFYIQDQNQISRGNDFRMRFAWRLFLLLIIGNINALFFPGEVLVLYALVGFALLPVARLSNRQVFAVAVILLMQPMEWIKLIMAVVNPSDTPVISLSSPYWDALYPVLEQGTFMETLKVNIWEGQIASLTWAWENARFFQTPALFMLGMLSGRLQLFSPTEQNKNLWIKILVVSLLFFFPLSGLLNMLPEFITDNKHLLRSLQVIIKSLANFSFMLFIVSTFTWLYFNTSLKKIFAKLSPYGRMSLTNYITQSIIGSMLFFNWGFGLYKLGITYSFLIGIAIFILQYSFCVWWMKNHKQGILENLWKKATWIADGRK